MEFYSEEIQKAVGPVVMLPQKGSVSGGSKRPLNSWAIVRPNRSILFDAPFSWTMDGIRRLAADGHGPAAMVLSHRDLGGSGDAFTSFVEEFRAPIMVHAGDRAGVENKAGVMLEGVETAPALDAAGVEVIHIPGHTPGSIMLWIEDEGGILLAGDSAVGPGPEQEDQSPRLQRPVGADEDPRFAETWQQVLADRPLAAVLPLHGRYYTRADEGDEAFEAMIRNIWEGPPMDPSGG